MGSMARQNMKTEKALPMSIPCRMIRGASHFVQDTPSGKQVHCILDKPCWTASGKHDIDCPVRVDLFEGFRHVDEEGCPWSGVVEVLLDGKDGLLRFAEVVEH